MPRRAELGVDNREYYTLFGRDYILDLAGWHCRHDGRLQWFARIPETADSMFHVRPGRPPEQSWRGSDDVVRQQRIRVLDFGGGIGSDALVLAERGYDVTLFDYASEAFYFAKWRAKRHGIRMRFEAVGMGFDPFLTSELDEDPQPLWDMVLFLDVLEHIPHYGDLLRWALRDPLQPRAVVISAPFMDPNVADSYHPQHLLARESIVEVMKPLGYRELDGLFWVHDG